MAHPKPLHRNILAIGALVLLSATACRKEGFLSQAPDAAGAVESPPPYFSQAPGNVLTPPNVNAPPLILTPPTIATAVEFGTSEVYHIGDGAFSGSNCKFQLSIKNTAGKKYIFQFEVQQANTRVDISINKICGLNEQSASTPPYSAVSLVAISGVWSELANVPLKKAAHEGQQLFIPTQYLNPGLYNIEVQAGLSGQTPTDLDDFVIGKIQIRSDKGVTSKGVTFQ